MSIPYNPILDIDSYKSSHPAQLPFREGYISSYIESRGGAFSETVFFGLQYILKEYFSVPVTYEMIEEAVEFFKYHGTTFYPDLWKYIVEHHGGYLPLKIWAVPEGMVIPNKHPLVRIENTDRKCPWLPGNRETSLMRLWYPITVATVSHYVKHLISQYMRGSSEDSDIMTQLPYKLHDFGARGVSSLESARIGGAAHLINFVGTDNVEAIRFADHYYQGGMAGFSINAMEHSSVITWGRNREFDSYRNMLDMFKELGRACAIVIDSYDPIKVIEELAKGDLRDRIVYTGGTVVIRPDSGDPKTMVETVMRLLIERFGSFKNSKGYLELPEYIRVLQGDGVNIDSISQILAMMRDNGWSASNISFGMGGGLLQKVDRDTLKFAMKPSAKRLPEDPEWTGIRKEPETDHGKWSKLGRLTTVRTNTGFDTMDMRVPIPQDSETIREVMEPVWENGQLLREMTFDEIRTNANQ